MTETAAGKFFCQHQPNVEVAVGHSGFLLASTLGSLLSRFRRLEGAWWDHPLHFLSCLYFAYGHSLLITVMMMSHLSPSPALETRKKFRTCFLGVVKILIGSLLACCQDEDGCEDDHFCTLISSVFIQPLNSTAYQLIFAVAYEKVLQSNIEAVWNSMCSLESSFLVGPSDQVMKYKICRPCSFAYPGCQVYEQTSSDAEILELCPQCRF